jgi:hypothetical protein
VRVTDSNPPDTISAPSIPEPDPLDALRAEFPGFRIWQETTCDRTIYNAISLRWEINPHTVVTDNLDELRGTLREARAAQPGTGRPQ